MTTPLFLLRCVQLGLSIGELDLLTIGLVNDMYVESRNDEHKYAVVATQKDFDLFEPGYPHLLQKKAHRQRENQKRC